MSPKAFISYSWSSDSHREMVRNWADRLIADGVEVLLDQYDLKEGQDKNSFMERMVTDPTVTHVLMICDRIYAEKADARKAGVGTESQIISQEVYRKVDQSKFIPIVCEFSPEGEPCVPTFTKSRIWLNFSSPELANNNWEQLVRLLFGKPLLLKPALGKPPAYVLQDSKAPANPAISRFAVFKQALLQGRTGITLYRNDFLDACFEYADALRVRSTPTSENFVQSVLEVTETLLPIRDLIINWVMLEASTPHAKDFEDTLNQILERLLELKARPKEVNTWNEEWFEAHRLFVYQTFLYIAAALLRQGNFKLLHEIFFSHYLLPETANHGDRFGCFEAFYGYSRTLNSVLAPAGQRLLSPAAALVKRQATRQDLNFEAIMEADLLALLTSALNENVRWFPQTLYYAGYGKVFPLFVRATQHKHFLKLAEITGIDNADELREKTKKGFVRLGIEKWSDFHFYADVSFWTAMNMDKLDTLK
ncbi:MAG: TIR domain-containing protein [Verrucomicrobia bacterium]|nr:TIR domain-containing protein [Verrucomicrobiota bacterium]